MMSEVFPPKSVENVIEKCFEKYREDICKKSSAEKIEMGFYHPKGALFSVGVCLWKTPEDYIGHFSLTELSGCCGTLVSHGSRVEEKYRGKGIGNLLMLLREDIAKRMKYSQMIATARSTNEVQKFLFSKRGWVMSGSYRNSRTGNMVINYYKNLGD